MANDTLEITEEITCDVVSELNKDDYESCTIEFDENNNALVTIVGKGKFAGKSVCNATRSDASVSTEGCVSSGVKKILSLLDNESVLNNGLVQTTATYTNADNEEITLDSGIRYVGNRDEVNNQVYFNCEEKDSKNSPYGSAEYDYKSSCEVWRIIGVFDVSNGDKVEKRIKIINTNSTFSASFDSSADGTKEGETAVNEGWGVNQWGPSTLADGTPYPGADIMQLLNGYYIGVSGSECKYNTGRGESGFSETCTKEGLTSLKMKPLTGIAKGMIDNALWYTYGVRDAFPPTTYLDERGITKKYTGCSGTEETECIADGITRNNKWNGKVGLASINDMYDSGGWLEEDEWLISPMAVDEYGTQWFAGDVLMTAGLPAFNHRIFPSVYLKSNIKLTGSGTTDDIFKIST